MIWPCHETLRQASVHLSDGLLSAQALSSLRALASRLPEAMSSYYLEFRLAPGVSQVDFSTCVTVQHGGRSVLQRMHGVLDRTGNGDGSARHGAQSFLGCWATPSSALHDQIPLVWLEFDQASEGLPGTPVPCVNFCLDPFFLKHRGAHPDGFHPNTLHHQPFVDVALEQLFGQPTPERTRRTLRRCFEALPPGGHIDYLAVMLARNPAALKANIILPRQQLAEYLSRIDWPGEWDMLERVLDTYIDPSSPMRLDVTIGETVLPRLGIECFAGNLASAAPGKLRLLERLVEHGHCCSRKRDAILLWPGESQVIFAGQSWLTRLTRSWYLKLVCHAGRLIEAKAYLGFTPGLISPFAYFSPAHSERKERSGT